MLKRTIEALLLIAAALGASACGSDGGGATTVNGCDAATAEDHTAEAVVMVSFGGTFGNTYSPACVKAKAGSGIMFMGDFAAHPLSGGVDGVKDAASPIKETTSSVSVEFDSLPAGTFGFFCELHDAAGMHGALFVE